MLILSTTRDFSRYGQKKILPLEYLQLLLAEYLIQFFATFLQFKHEALKTPMQIETGPS